jgi:hypothetical protein
MKSLSKIRRSRTGTWLIAPVCLLSIVSALAQRDRISHVLDNYRTVVVPGHLIPLAKAEFDHGAVPGDFALRGMTLTVRRSAAQQKDLNQLLTAQQNPASPSYHKWLTPEAFAKRFGASSNDLETLRQWLESQGFQIKTVARGGTFIRFDATASQVQNAFKTEIHQYTVNGAKHYANASEPSLPANLAPLVLAVGGMNDFAPHPNSAKLPTRNAKVKAHYYDSSDNTDLAPGDLAAIYDIGPLQTASGVNYGLGQTVVVIGTSDVNPADLPAYCVAFAPNSFGCAENFSQMHVGTDPTETGDALQAQATADVELVKAVAPGATLLLETDGDAGGVWAAFADAVDNARGQVILMSYGQCESTVGSGPTLAIQATAQAANAQGITVIAASGDSGGAACDTTPVVAATGGLAVSVPADIPEVTGVGGTEFTDTSTAGVSNGSTGGSIPGYIQEVAWNDNVTAVGGNQYSATGGGVSTVFTTNPSWQTGTGVLNTGRNVPDVALSASSHVAPYMVVLTTGGSRQTLPTGSGTEASSAVFAGMVALINAANGAAAGSGNINPALYAVAGGGNGYSGDHPAFHAITAGGNLVPCVGPNCPESGFLGYAYTAGYDQATGLGSVDAYNLQQAWPAPTATISSFSPAYATAGGSAFELTVIGTGFNPAAVVLWAGTPQATTFVDAEHLTIEVSQAKIASVGNATVAVLNNDCTTSLPSLFPIDAAPTATITSLSPSSATATGSGFTLTVNGTGFVSGANIKFNGTQLSSTTVVSGTQLTGPVTSGMIASPETASVTVVNGDSTTSLGYSFTVNPVPNITSLSVSTATAGNTSGVAVTITGSGFSTGSTVYWAFNSGQAALIAGSSCGSTVSCTATIPPASLTTAGPATIKVVTLDSVSSNTKPFTVAAAPSITSLSKSSATAGNTAGVPITVTGSGFSAGSHVYWSFNSGTATLITGTNTCGLTTSCTATIPPASLTTAGSAAITVVTADGVASGSSAFTVAAPPTISSPLTLVATKDTQQPVAVNITGSNISAGSHVFWAFNSGTNTQIAGTNTCTPTTSCTATVPITSLTTAGPAAITVVTADGVASTNSIAFTVAPHPTISSITGTATAGNANGSPLTINGTGFTVGTGVSVSWTIRGVPHTLTSSCTATVCTVTVPTGYLLTGTASIMVVSFDGVDSNVQTLTVAPVPVINWVTPAKVSAGSPDLPITITGTGFASGYAVKWNGGSLPLQSAYVNATTITATVPAADLTTNGTGNITVVTADGVISNAQTFNIGSAPTISGLAPQAATAGAPGVNGLLPVTITGTNFTSGSIVKWNTQTLSSVYSSQTSLVASVPASYLTNVGTAAITVVSSASLGSISSAASTNSIFTINAAPVISSISPTSASAGSTSTVPLTITGTGFSTGSTVTWQGRTSTYTLKPSSCGSLTTCTATIPASYLTTAGLATLSVKTLDGVSSNTKSFSVASAVITGFTPNYATVGSTFMLTVNGTGFLPGAAIWWQNQNVTPYQYVSPTTKFVSGTQLTAQIPFGEVPSSPGSVPVYVVNGDSPATTSVPVALTITAVGAPTITSLKPSSIVAGTPGTGSPAVTSITITGTNFIASTKAGSVTTYHSVPYLNLGGTPTAMTPTAGTATSITATIPSSDLTAAGVFGLTVVNNPSTTNVTSAATPFTVVGPTITSVSPAVIGAGSPDTSITVTGTNFVAGTGSKSAFVAGSNVYISTSAVPTPARLTASAGTATAITVTIPHGDLTTSGTVSLTVENPGSGAATSPAFTLDIGEPAITSLSATSAVAGSAGFKLTITGTNFISTSTVWWGSESAALAATYASTKTGATLTATVAAATELNAAGTFAIVVKNGTEASSPVMFTVNPPTITSMSPTSAAPSGAAATLTVNGTNFISKVSTVYWDTTALTTTYKSATQVTAPLTTAMLTAGLHNVTVQNGGTSGASLAAQFGVGLTIEQLSPSAAFAGSNFSMIVTGTNFAAGATVMWNGVPLATTPTTAGSTTSLTATVTTAQTAVLGAANITVMNSNIASSAASTFTVNAPTIASLSATSAVAGSGSFTLTVTGTGFVSGVSKVMWNGVQLGTNTYVSPTSLTALVSGTQLAIPGAQNVTVWNGSAAGASSPVTFTVNGPTIGSLSSNSAIAGSTPFTLTVTGTNFLASSKVWWGTEQASLTTTYVSPTQLTAAVTSTELAQPGTPGVTVQNGSATAVSGAPTFTVSAPQITSLSSNSAVAGSAPFTLTVNGSNFLYGSTVYWGVTPLTTTYVSASQLTASVTSSQLASAGMNGTALTVAVTVQNFSATAVSAASTFTVSGPTITTLSSTSDASGSTGFSLTVTGTNFVSGANTVPSVVYWDSTPLTTTVNSATSVTAAVTTALLTNGAHNVTVQNASAVSNAKTFGTGVAISSLSQSSVGAGTVGFTLTVNGTNFVSGYEIMWDGVALGTTTYVGATQLTAPITTLQLAVAGTHLVTVQNVAGSIVSNSITFTIGTPTITTLAPNSAFAGSLVSSATLSVTVTGTNFVSGSTVYWGATALATTYNSATSLTATVTHTQLDTAVAGSITVQNSGTVASSASTFTVSAPTITTLAPNSAVAGSLTSPLSVTVTGTNFVSGSTVYWGLTALATTYNSATSLTATVTATQLATAGPGSVTVQNTATAATSASTFTVSAPTIVALSSTAAVATDSNFTLTVTGTNFIAGSKVWWGSEVTPLATTYVSSTVLTATVTKATELATAGAVSVTVQNGATTATSNGITFTVAAAPTLTSVTSTATVTHNKSASVTLTGTGFVAGSTVMFGTTPIATTFVSSTSLTAAVTAAEIPTASAVSVTVVGPGGATTAAQTLTVH